MLSIKTTLKTLSASFVLFSSASVLSAPIQHLITPADIGDVDCTNTAAFTSANACVGAVVDPNNDVGSFPNLMSYLNGEVGDYDKDKKTPDETGYVGTTDGLDPWGEGTWTAVSNQVDPPPGTSGDGILTTIGSGTSGTFKFDVSSKAMDLAYFVVSVKGGASWSTYYYDVSGQGLTMFSDTWDTLGIQTGGGKPAPGLSHMFGAYILEEDDTTNPPGNIPLPGTLLLFGLGLFSLSLPRFKRRRD